MAANIKILGYLSHNNRQKPISDAKNAIKYAEADREHHQNIPYLFGEEKESHEQSHDQVKKLEAMAKSFGAEVSYSKSIIPKAELNFNNVNFTTLEEIAESLGVQVYSSGGDSPKAQLQFDDEGRPVINLQMDDQTLKSLELAHNMGYLLDIRDNFASNAVDWADAFKKEPLATERRAWMTAVDLLKRSGFKNWDEFKSHCENSLSANTDDEKKVQECLKEIENHISQLDKNKSEILFSAKPKHSIHLKGMDQTLKSIELAHHMGYLLDIRDNFGNNAESWADAFQKDPLATERKAWMNAAKFLEKSGFSNWDRFSGHCQQNLSAIADDEKKVRECLQEIESHIPELSKMQMMAKEIEAEIKYAKITGGDGLIRMEGISAKPTVYVNADTSIDQKLIAIAHELGHAKDFRERFQSDIEQWIDKGEKNTLELEQKAWLNAVDLLKRSGFTNWDKFREEMRSGYKSYTDRRFSEEESEKEVNNFLKEVERYIPKPDRVDRREFFKRIEQQPRHGIVMHKWVISLSEDERDRLQIDMKQLARDFMNRLQMRYNIKLDWVAAIHDDKGHPHVHISVRGWDKENKKQFAVYPTHIKEMRKMLEEEKIRQAERNLGKEQTRDILKEIEQEREQERIPFVPRQGGNRFLNSIIDQIIKSIQEDARRNEREIERQQMLEKQKLERERKQKESRSR